MLLLALALALPPQAPTPPPDPAVQRLAAAQSTPARTDALLQLTDTLPAASLPTLRVAIPIIMQSADSPDPQVRSLAMLALTAITNRPEPASALLLLEPYLPVISRHLTDPSLPVRQVAALVLGGFLDHPTLAVIAPLLTALQAPSNPPDFSLSVVFALLTLNLAPSDHPEISPAILHFVLRPDLPTTLTPRLVSAISNHANHSILLDTGLLALLDSTHPAPVRAALIAGLPRLALSQPDVDRTRARLARIASSPGEPAAIKNVAAAILPCWHTPRMTDPCPALPVRYRMRPAPPRSPVTPPRYQSPSLNAPK